MGGRFRTARDSGERSAADSAGLRLVLCAKIRFGATTKMRRTMGIWRSRMSNAGVVGHLRNQPLFSRRYRAISIPRADVQRKRAGASVRLFLNAILSTFLVQLTANRLLYTARGSAALARSMRPVGEERIRWNSRRSIGFGSTPLIASPGGISICACRPHPVMI